MIPTRPKESVTIDFWSHAWLANISWENANILLTKDSVLCSEHFTRIKKNCPLSFAECFQQNFRAELVGTKSKARLKPGPVPTIFSHRPPPCGKRHYCIVEIRMLVHLISWFGTKHCTVLEYPTPMNWHKVANLCCSVRRQNLQYSDILGFLQKSQSTTCEKHAWKLTPIP